MFTTDDLKINKFKLDEEAAKQSSLYHYYSDQLADARNLRDVLTNDLDKLLAQVEIEIRRNPPSDIKVTESVIKSLVLSDDRIVDKKSELTEAKKRVYELEAIVNGLDHKKSMLKILTELYVVGYYRFDDFNATTQVQDEIRKKLNEKRKSKNN